MEEKRKFVRLNISVNVNYSIRPDLEPVMEDTTKNIGGGGICLETNEKLNLNSVLDLKFYLPDDKNSIVAVGKVVWSEEFSVGGALRYEAGIEFIKIDEDDREKIKKYVFKSLKPAKI